MLQPTPEGAGAHAELFRPEAAEGMERGGVAAAIAAASSDLRVRVVAQMERALLAAVARAVEAKEKKQEALLATEAEAEAGRRRLEAIQAAEDAAATRLLREQEVGATDEDAEAVTAAISGIGTVATEASSDDWVEI